MRTQQNYIGSDGWDYAKHTTGENFAHGFLHPIDYSKSVAETYETLPKTGVTGAVGTAVKVVTSVSTPVLTAAETVKDGAVALVKKPFELIDDLFGSLKWVIAGVLVIVLINFLNKK